MLRVAWVTILALGALPITTHSASAQLCNGSAPFSAGVVRIGVTGGTTAGAEHVATEGSDDGGFGLQFTVGGLKRFFASASGLIVLYQGPTRFSREGLAARREDDAGAVVASGTVGYAIPVSTSVTVCPIIGVSRQIGPALWAECSAGEAGGHCSGIIDGQGWAVWSGGTVGGLARSFRRFSVAPFAGVSYVRSTLTARGELSGPFSDESASATAGYVAITAGVGFLFEKVMFRPVASFPAGLEGGGLSSGLEISFIFGPKAAG